MRPVGSLILLEIKAYKKLKGFLIRELAIPTKKEYMHTL